MAIHHVPDSILLQAGEGGGTNLITGIDTSTKKLYQGTPPFMKYY
jgi:hypothetical protein